MTTKKDDVTDAPADRVLVLTRVFNAPRHLVFEAWTKKEHYDKWSCPRGFTMGESQADFRPGGGFAFVMIGPDGGKYSYSGRYREFVPDELLVMTHGWLEDDGTRPYETIRRRWCWSMACSGRSNRAIFTKAGGASASTSLTSYCRKSP
jgi:uncharacterized protein YndB with AHSA1/START domain